MLIDLSLRTLKLLLPLQTFSLVWCSRITLKKTNFCFIYQDIKYLLEYRKQASDVYLIKQYPNSAKFSVGKLFLSSVFIARGASFVTERPTYFRIKRNLFLNSLK